MRALAIFFLSFFGTIAAQDTLRTIVPTEITDSTNARFRTRSGETRFLPDSTGAFTAVGTSADAVLQQAPGTQILNYGGHGGVKTLSLRGFAANQTGVMLCGVPYQNSQTGLINFGNFFPDGYSAISVSQHPASPNHNPLGGTVSFAIAPQKTALQAKVGLGSFREKILQVSSSVVRPRWAFMSSYYRLTAADDFPFAINGVTGTRSHAAFTGNQGLACVEMSPAKPGGWRIAYGLMGATDAQQVPDAIVKGSQPSPLGDSLSQKDVFSWAHFSRGFTAHAIQHIQLSASYHENTLLYRGKGASARKPFDSYLNKDALVSLETRHCWGDHLVETSLQGTRATLVGNN